MSIGDNPLLDPQAVLRSFSSKLRGYDSDEVDAHLRSIANALRSAARETPSSGADLDGAHATIERLTAEVATLEARIDELQAVEAPAPLTPASSADGEPFDEHRAMQLLGEETTRVLETARQSAATIVGKAETSATERTEAVDALEAKVKAELAELRDTTEAELADNRSTAEEALAELRKSTEAELADRMAASKRKITDQQATAKTDAEKIVADARAKAKELNEAAAAASTSADEEAAAAVAAAAAEAAGLRSGATEEAASIRAEADTESARMRAEAEADALAAQESARETARLMVVEAQRVREKVLGDLVVRRRQGRQQVDQAKAARDRLARALQEVRGQIDASVTELDVALPEAKAALSDLSKPETPTDDEAQIRELEAELDSAGSRAAGHEAVVASGSAALAPAQAKAADEAAAKESAGKESTGKESAGEEPAAEAPDRVDGDDSDEEEQEEEIAVPEPFLSRDVAMTRFGAALRRKLKRVMADEQSDLLDRLQRSKKLSLDDLASADEQRQLYVAAVAPPLRSAAAAGADMHGGSVDDSATDALVESLVADVFDQLRSRVESSVGGATDIDDVLEPLRAHYRDVRLTDVPGLTDDALSDAFALGAYQALADGTELQWVSDPRFEPSSDCFDDTLADDVVKPNAFPTGRVHPSGQPECRCVVVPRTSD